MIGSKIVLAAEIILYHGRFSDKNTFTIAIQSLSSSIMQIIADIQME